MKKIALLIVGGLIAVTAFASERIDAGEEMPNLKAVSSNGDAKPLHGFIGDKPAVVLFVRSADWCGYCKKQLIDWNEAKPEFDERGYDIISVSYDAPEVLASFKEARGINFTMLSDPNSQTIKALGILNENIEEGKRAYGIPNPAIYVVDKDGAITHVFREEDYKNRPKITDVMAALVGTM